MGLIYLVADNLKTHKKSALLREWLEQHPRIGHAFIPKGAAWLNLIEVWWRLFRRQALGGVDFADSYEIDPRNEGRYSPVESESEAVGVGPASQTTEAPDAHFCVPPLRNGALKRIAVILASLGRSIDLLA
jgi:DDE superfamily endonuclease